MENATDALKMAFGVFVFIIALSIALYSFTNAKETADAILWATDKTNFYEWTDSQEQKKGREVGKDTIIATLFQKQTDTYIIIDLESQKKKYIFNYTGVVTEVNRDDNTVIRTINTNETGLADDGTVKMNYKINFANDVLKTDKTYYENISEVTNKGQLGGEYVTAEDGTKLQVVKGDNKVIITYTEK